MDLLSWSQQGKFHLYRYLGDSGSPVHFGSQIVWRLRSSRAQHHDTRISSVYRKHPWSVCPDDPLSLVPCTASDIEECDLFHPVRLALVDGARAVKRGLEKSTFRVGVAWPHLSGETKDEISKGETEDSLI